MSRLDTCASHAEIFASLAAPLSTKKMRHPTTTITYVIQYTTIPLINNERARSVATNTPPPCRSNILFLHQHEQQQQQEVLLLFKKNVSTTRRCGSLLLDGRGTTRHEQPGTKRGNHDEGNNDTARIDGRHYFSSVTQTISGSKYHVCAIVGRWGQSRMG